MRDNDAPIIKITGADKFSRPMDFESARSVQHTNSFQSGSTAPIRQHNGNMNERDSTGSYDVSAGDLATPSRVSNEEIVHVQCSMLRIGHPIFSFVSFCFHNSLFFFVLRKYSCSISRV